MAELIIHRGTHQIGGCCTELSVNGNRILIDFGASLPGSESSAPLSDQKLAEKVFDGRPAAAVLFTHYHGDHYGLFKRIPKDVPLYIGGIAKEILSVLVPYIDIDSEEKGMPRVKEMHPYRLKEWLELEHAPGIRILPLYVDHSALDSYMFYIEAAGKRILFTGDFRDHGIVGEKDRVWRTLRAYVPRNIDLLITEGTMLSRISTVRKGPWLDDKGDEHIPVRTEAELGAQARKLFLRSKYNFVLVSSTNLDSIMEFYHNTPPELPFVCDLYQARVILNAMQGMEHRGSFPMYYTPRHHPVLRVLGEESEKWDYWRKVGRRLRYPLKLQPITEEELEQSGFVLLARKNSHPKGYTSPFEELRDTYFDRDGQIIYSMWDGYLKPEHADEALLNYISNRKVVRLHTSGHAYVETIARLIKTVQPKLIVPMHTEQADEFSSIPEFAPYKDRVKVLKDGEVLPLDKL